MATQVRPYGSWDTVLTADRLTAGSLRLSQPRLDHGDLYWLEGRPAQGGRQVVMRQRLGSAPEPATPDDVSVRTRVHEYGGGDYVAKDGDVLFVRDLDQRVIRASDGMPLTPAGVRCADLQVSPDGDWLVAVEEAPRGEGEPRNRLIAVRLRGSSGVVEVASGFDFVSFPRFSPHGDALVFTAWNHPNMPWDATELWWVDWGARGPGARRRVAGGSAESIFQPCFSPTGRLTYVTDRSGWWNLEQIREGTRIALYPSASEFGRPQWVFGLSTYGFVTDDRLLCVRGEMGRYRLGCLESERNELTDFALPFDAFDGVDVEGTSAALIAAGPCDGPTVGRFDVQTGAFEPVRPSLDAAIDEEDIATPESWTFNSSDGERVHAFLYRPASQRFQGVAGTRPPLLVKGHGGPTGAATSALNLGIQYWTSRGFAVLDVNYRGSTGFGRAYRERLRGRWGEIDVSDCVEAASALARQGIVDGERMAISGGSAGGFTVLCALTFYDVFGAGASHYGIGDLAALARGTHKFEARYCDGLVAPYPEGLAVYRARSPLHHVDQLACPVIFFQGLEDRVVPPSQAEAMVSVLAERGLPHAYVAFEGEQHGFRRAENQRTALEGELYFYSRVFGFETDVSPAGIEIKGLSAGRGR